MLPLLYARYWRTAGGLLLLGVLAAALLPGLPDLNQAQFPADKWLHGLTFTGLTLWFAGQYEPRSYWRVALGLLAFGALTEVCQRMVTYRSAEALDLLADAIGIVAGLGIARVGAGGWSLRFEAWLAQR